MTEPSNFHQEIKFLLDECDQFLAPHEKTFLEDISEWYGGLDGLSESQLRYFRTIREKCSRLYAEMESHDGSEFRWDQ